MLSTLENKSKKNFGRAGFLGLGAGLYSGLNEVIVVSCVVVGIYFIDLYLTWKESRGE